MNDKIGTATTDNQLLSSQLIELKNQFESASEKAGMLVADLNPNEMMYRTAPWTWSIAECIVHLTLTSRTYIPILNSVLDEAEKSRRYGQGPFKMDMIGRFLNWSLKPPPRFKTKTTQPFQPVEIGNIDETLPDFLILQKGLVATLERSQGFDLNKVKIQSVFNERIRYNLYSCFNIIATHERRHLWQAEQIKKSLSENK